MNIITAVRRAELARRRERRWNRAVIDAWRIGDLGTVERTGKLARRAERDTRRYERAAHFPWEVIERP